GSLWFLPGKRERESGRGGYRYREDSGRRRRLLRKARTKPGVRLGARTKVLSGERRAGRRPGQEFLRISRHSGTLHPAHTLVTSAPPDTRRGGPKGRRRRPEAQGTPGRAGQAGAQAQAARGEGGAAVGAG
ncbi:hypothetical protein BC834DRAFT_1035840, partial [Gloeopeniophorella convolvens]